MKPYQILINQGISWKMKVLKRSIISVFAGKKKSSEVRKGMTTNCRCELQFEIFDNTRLKIKVLALVVDALRNLE